MIPFFQIESFQLGPLHFYVWGVFLGLAFLTGLIFALKIAKKQGIGASKIINLAVFVYLGALAGSRLFFSLQWPADFFSDPKEFFQIAQGGLMLYGGVFGGLLVGWLYLRKWKNHWRFVDLLTSVIPLCMAIGRIGCFLINDHQGALTSLPWAIRWPDGSLHHPVALYLILFDLALFGFLWLWQKKTKWPGQIFFLFLVFYSAGRFLLDFTRDPSADPHYLWFSATQWISLVVLTGLFLYAIIRKTKIMTG